MSDLTAKATLQLHVAFTMNEPEARALDALVGYGDDEFIKVFYEKLGEAYMKPHEAGLRSLFRSVREQLPPILQRANAARGVFKP